MSILERYQDRANGYKLDSSCLWKLGLLRKTENAKLLLDYGTLHAFVKTPHSVTYKCRFYPYASSPFFYNREKGSYEVEYIDHDCGSANVYHYVKDGKDMLVSTNREIDEVALYKITEE